MSDVKLGPFSYSLPVVGSIHYPKALYICERCGQPDSERIGLVIQLRPMNQDELLSLEVDRI